VNQVVRGETDLAPAALLETALAIEQAHGRQRSVPNAPRTLDIDILFFGDRVVEEPGLTIPHPRLHERRFVLVPLAEIAPDFRHPVLGLTVRELLARCSDTSRVVAHSASAAGLPR
jgi:2-amino-4-hydroxy-6-hydroxymethyldihydropteridine diphosphokinase